MRGSLHGRFGCNFAGKHVVVASIIDVQVVEAPALHLHFICEIEVVEVCLWVADVLTGSVPRNKYAVIERIVTDLPPGHIVESCQGDLAGVHGIEKSITV